MIGTPPGMGLLRERVTIRQPTVTLDEIGSPSTTFADVATVWARVEPIRLDEQQYAERQVAYGRYRVTMRYRSGLVYTMQIVWRGRTLNIDEIKNADERRRFLTLTCRDGNPNQGAY